MRRTCSMLTCWRRNAKSTWARGGWRRRRLDRGGAGPTRGSSRVTTFFSGQVPFVARGLLVGERCGGGGCHHGRCGTTEPALAVTGAGGATGRHLGSQAK